MVAACVSDVRRGKGCMEIDNGGLVPAPNRFNAVMDSILEQDLPPTDTEGLKVYEARLRDQLQKAAMDGIAGKVIQLQNELREIPVLACAFELKELKSKLDEVEFNLQQTKADEVSLEEIQKQRNAELAPLIVAVEDAQFAVRKVQASLYQNDSRRQSLLESRRGYRKRLEQLTQEIRDGKYEN